MKTPKEMRRIGQIEAKTNGEFIESFESREAFYAKKARMELLASNMGRQLAYIVIPFIRGGRMVMYQVFLMPKGYEFQDDRRMA